MFKGPGKIVRDNKSSSYPVFELTGVNCIQKYFIKNVMFTDSKISTFIWLHDRGRGWYRQN